MALNRLYHSLYIIFLPPANGVCEGYVFYRCLSVHGGGGGRACLGGGGHAWQGGAGACVAGGCVARGCTWLRGRDMAGETATAEDGTHPTGMHPYKTEI